jgi:hypothetical protein
MSTSIHVCGLETGILITLTLTLKLIHMNTCICVLSGHLEEQVVIAIKLLLKFNQNEDSEEEINKIKEKSVVNDLSRLSVDVLQYDSIASLITSRGYLGQFYWSLKNDSRIIDLLNHACDCKITGNMSVTINKESESNIPFKKISATLDKRLPLLGSSVKSTSSDIPDEQKCVESLEESKDSRQKIEEKYILQNVQQILKQSASKIAFICRVEV